MPSFLVRAKPVNFFLHAEHPSAARLKRLDLDSANVTQCLCCTPEDQRPAIFLFVPLRHFLCIGTASQSLTTTCHFVSMAQPIHTYTTLVLVLAHIIFAQQQCYFGPGAQNRGPSNLVPCMNTGQSACCLLGDVCLSGNACWNYDTGNTYQYGCTDISYKDKTCPYKCGFNSSKITLLALLMACADGKQPYRHGLH
jgi:hypothetical protein